MTNKTRKWVRAGLEAFIHGGTAAVSSSLGAATIDSLNWGIGTPNGLKLAGVTFLSNGGLRFFQWWQNNPLPDPETVPPIGGSTPVISVNPLSKVQPMVQQPPVEPPKP
jgi:hypothetical protein